ncbi:uncharacterized protein LAESUDRAFT_738725 [Laetiporus sulphureus 93-53]|uniref:Hemimethylated DNA-binding domain-containing protein n=1 Tax=Laetiporus sulphureus 93-53 TaxID=1314785 RepID=A0A165C9G4_9APHY|nr:uncharacterized protein LAESUDRAFT_738725 [Laetiporus sulphureus 93-53]KZT02433.1 hypothetical protein LAESUDRAFT_738725 [Laetiporus sulphureus 93-53]
MSRPWLPTEVYAHILSFLPAAKDLADESVKTLVACLSANSALRDAALHPGLWEPHYRTRYTECVEEHEAKRRVAVGDNWQKLYVMRREIDRRALALVDEIRLQLQGRHVKAREFVRKYSFDAWDALEVEAELPLPAYFRPASDADIEADMNWEVPHALPRRYWARAVMGVIARHHTLQLWTRLFCYSEDEDAIPFEDALAGLSAFFDKSPRRIPVWLCQLANRCRRVLSDEGFELNSQSPAYDLSGLCVRIRGILWDLGHDFYNLINQFPHSLMGEGPRRTIPMSLMYIFVSICQRLGIRAAPTDCPGKVLCHITPPDSRMGELLFDLCNNTSPYVFHSWDPPSMLLEVGLPADASPDLVRPCRVGATLRRAAMNIMSVHRNQLDSTSPFSERLAWCSYGASCIFLLHSRGNEIWPYTLDSKPLDALVVLTDVVCPALVPEKQAYLEKRCTELVRSDDEFAKTLWPRSQYSNVTFFVGLVVQHVRYKYVGCIIGWHVNLTSAMEVQRFGNNWEQPFYWIITINGAKGYVAESDLTPVRLDRSIARCMFESRTIFGRFFEDVEMNESQHRGRLLPSEELQTLFPEDDSAGALWIATGMADKGKPVIRPLRYY